jgi:hypothetical protein
MPREKYVGSDPDPTEYLYVSLEAKRKSAAKPYDAKKSCWVPSAKQGFVLGDIRSAKGDQITVFASNKVKNPQSNSKMYKFSRIFLMTSGKNVEIFFF